MKKFTFFISLSALFLGMIVLIQNPLITLGMDKDERLQAAFANSFSKENYLIRGKLQASTLEVLIEGSVQGEKKFFQISSRNQNVLGSYFEDVDQRVIQTPLEAYKLLMFEKTTATKFEIEGGEDLFKELIRTASVQEKVAIKIQEGTSSEVWVNTECYTLVIEDLILEKLLMEEPLNGALKAIFKGMKGLTFKVYVDPNLLIRRIELECSMEGLVIMGVVTIEDYDRVHEITEPDTTQAIQLKGTLEEVVGEWMKQQVPLY